jgi:thioredoxin reductase
MRLGGVEANPEWDVIVVGGGPSGLSAALVLGRCCRRTLVCDSCHPRNAASREVHGFLTRDCTPPLEFLRSAREDLKRYPGVEFRSAEVVDARALKDCFEVVLADGAALRARILLLATGVVDELPRIKGVERFYGKSVHHCPYCDGWEHRGQRIAVHGNGTAAFELAVELLCWSPHISILADGTPAFTSEQQVRLGSLNIGVYKETIARLEGNGEVLEQVVFEDGSACPCDALFFSPKQTQRSQLPGKLGCTFTEEGEVKCSESTATNVPGLYVVGNASPGFQLVIFAAAEGTRAALAINEQLLEADLSRMA